MWAASYCLLYCDHRLTGLEAVEANGQFRLKAAAYYARHERQLSAYSDQMFDARTAAIALIRFRVTLDLTASSGKEIGDPEQDHELAETCVPRWRRQRDFGQHGFQLE